jgi:cobalt/nickel transport system permease protein
MGIVLNANLRIRINQQSKFQVWRLTMKNAYRSLEIMEGKKPEFPRWFLAYYLGVAVWLVTTGMHIPDGYLSPVTSLVMFILVLPFWARGVSRLRNTLNARNVPLIALLAAFSFVIMMFNVPLPGGTTGHAVGGALAAIILGPEVATIVISIALVIQAFFFGDGGILALGANSFNMAVVLPYIAYYIYMAVAGGSSIDSRRRPLGAAIGGWTGLTVAAFFAGVEFGLQPLLFHSANGTPLYAPYPLSVAIPAMVIPHMLVASVIEGLLTALVVAYLQRSNQAALKLAGHPSQAADAGGLRKWRAAWLALILTAMATPLGLLAPGTAWGEWSSKQLTELGLKFIPEGLLKLESLWGAPMARYEVPALGNASLGYMLSAFLGILLVGIMAALFSALFTGLLPSGKRAEDPVRDRRP